eukprot:COSAG05_NODE_3188_length_2256_cov_1.159870_3_plen_71_part_00
MFLTVLAIVLAIVFRPYEDSRANGFYVGGLVGDTVCLLFCRTCSDISQSKHLFAAPLSSCHRDIGTCHRK